MPVERGSTKARKPTALKLVKGTLNKSRANKAEPQVDVRIPDPPDHLDEDERAAWTKYAGLLGPMRVCAAEDFAALESLVTVWVQAQRLRAQLREDAKTGDKKLTYESITESGGKIERAKAALTTLNEVDRRVEKWLGKFGLSPADRSRVSAGKADGKKTGEDEFA